MVLASCGAGNSRRGCWRRCNQARGEVTVGTLVDQQPRHVQMSKTKKKQCSTILVRLVDVGTLFDQQLRHVLIIH
jgi:hypothetical protein